MSVIPIYKRPSQTQAARLVDEFGRLDAELRAIKPKQQRHEQLRRQIASWYEDEDASREFVVAGRHYTVEISARAKERRIRSMKALLDRLGYPVFLKLCTFPLKVLDEHFPAADRADLVEETYTGARRVTAIPKYQALARAG